NTMKMTKRGPTSVLVHYLRYLGGNTITVAAGFVSFPFMTRLLDNQQFGILGYYEAWLLLVTGVLKLAYRFMNFFVEVLFGISISTNSRIGRGFYIGHFGGIVVHGDLGEGCSIGQGVTIGSRGAGRSDGYPSIGKRVYLGAGAMVIGRVHVGDDVVVGANTVVVTDIPAGCRVVSAAVRILPPVITRKPVAAPASSRARRSGSVR
ncbi:MAG: hypothetical protein LC637_13470, partial [Xanthomonadaceae bacterium]|nr:hypothetical protein [Xanthomonadaceae bacterium]